jgi:hypothetical protein
VWVESVQTDERLQSCKTIETVIIRDSYAISRRVLDYGFVLLDAIGTTRGGIPRTHLGIPTLANDTCRCTAVHSALKTFLRFQVSQLRVSSWRMTQQNHINRVPMHGHAGRCTLVQP